MEFAEFLYTLRKEKGLTQSELAEKLGVTNKAVSKWETGEGYPETAQLVPLAGIFGVTVDELLKGERANGATSTHPDDGETDEENSEKSTEDEKPNEKKGAEVRVNIGVRAKNFINTLIMVAAIVGFLILGLVFGKWHPGWAVFPVAAIICGICDEIYAIVKNVRTGRRGRSVHAVCGIIMLIAVAAYLVIGFVFDKWHPGWIIFLFACLACILFDVIYKFICKNIYKK